MLISEMQQNWLMKKIRQDKEKIQKKSEKLGFEEFSGLAEERFFQTDHSGLTAGELMQNLSDQLSALNELIDIKKISFLSHRKKIGFFIKTYKKIIHFFLKPYINTILERQRLFNEGVVRYLLTMWQLEKKNQILNHKEKD